MGLLRMAGVAKMLPIIERETQETIPDIILVGYDDNILSWEIILG